MRDGLIVRLVLVASSVLGVGLLGAGVANASPDLRPTGTGSTIQATEWCEWHWNDPECYWYRKLHGSPW